MFKIGIDLGGTNIKVGLVNKDQQIVYSKSILTHTQRSYQEIVGDMVELVKEVCHDYGIEIAQLEAIGIGCPGLIDATHGTVPYSNNLGWKDVPLIEEFEKHFTCRIKVSNDANCAALGEVVAGAAKDVANAVLLTLGTGVGGGIILNGKVFEGVHAGGAELGHTTLVYGGEDCSCGRKGCVESYVSASALIRDAKRAVRREPSSKMMELCHGNVEEMTGKIPFDAAHEQDIVAMGLIEQYIDYLAEAITNYINIFRPDMILLSGGICNQGEFLTKPVEEKMKERCFGTNQSFIPPVRCAILGNQAGIIGAANL